MIKLVLFNIFPVVISTSYATRHLLHLSFLLFLRFPLGNQGNRGVKFKFLLCILKIFMKTSYAQQEGKLSFQPGVC